MKTLRRKLSYANVASSLCLFLLVSGGSAYAATQVAKDSVGNQELKRNAVSTGKIRNGAVTGSKIDLSTLGTVPSASHATSADTATHADGATTATRADTATSADTATRADSAATATSAGTAISAASATSAGTATSATTAAKAESLAPPEAVHFVGTGAEPPFENGFANKTFGGGPAGFYEDRQCVVHLIGQLEGASANTAFTLPAADRPPQEVFSALAAAGPKAANVQVHPNGTVVPAQAGGGFGSFGMDGVTFRVATC